MSDRIDILMNKASASDICRHLSDCEERFVQALNQRVSIKEYSKKIYHQAVRFEAWAGDLLIGLLAAYCNDRAQRVAYITSVSVLEKWQNKGVARQLMNQFIQYARQLGMHCISLEVEQENKPATALYNRFGFTAEDKVNSVVKMNLICDQGDKMLNNRDYNSEMLDAGNHPYAYDFDFDVMHPFMIRSFEPFFRKGNLLELGSYKGDFTKRLVPYFQDITCVEASDVALEAAKLKLGDQVKFVNALFETVLLPCRYHNIVMTHVLEHLDDPVRILKRINNEWLSDDGRLFLVCPNANAPSRQIAVKMGLISHNAAVTSAEFNHGHKITYSLDTLERDAKTAGFKVIYRSGIFFKALANFQWDRLLKTDIISPEYLEGCYQLGQQYPDLCASIFLLCEKGG